LKFFSKGVSESQRYRGPRDLPSLLTFIKETLGLADSTVIIVCYWTSTSLLINIFNSLLTGKCCRD